MVAARLIASVLSLPLLAASLAVRQDDGDVHIQTTFQIDQGCSKDQTKIIEQGQKDALELAKAVFDDCSELKTTADHHKCINWESQAVADYFGPKAMNRGQRERIYDTFNKAIDTKRHFWSDWWNDRYVFVFCRDIRKACRDDSPGYTLTNDATHGYPYIVYCPAFFKSLSDHQTLVDKIKKDESGQKKLNVKNLRSRATTVLHEWLHIKGYSSTVCEGGCDDTDQWIGPNGNEKVQTYKAGRTKLLASKDVEKAARTNDNYAYFAMSMWMQKNFDTYPPYPKMWDNSKSRKDNEENEKSEPGNPDPTAPDTAALELEDSAQGDASTTNQPYAKETYPDWYWPVLENLDKPETPQLNVPAWEVPVLQVTPDVEAGHCQTDDQSSTIDDCYAALGQLTDSLNMVPPLSGGEGYEWAGISGNCVIQIHYTDNWKDCNATTADIHAHAQLIVEGCADGGKGKVGGYIPFTPEKCPGTIDVTVKNGEQPHPPTQPAPPSDQCPLDCDCSSGTALCS
ncbi:hypothetical protein BDV96DRAFT_605644 [Lophiotrema nucula]|uniref:Lysine-specific metallo-endopeptidase domain-containing protein n=1 Tax=Lophiotrema nucula TaxID=690887 RepID=A0A6A5YR10_9PLEO|nr:hypothetical protein BDV96DRAFT_605644 [Lophiotrema nucula]